MEAVRSPSSTIVDLLDRVLDKGLVINADIIISVAGIPLIGVSLRAALAGMETMLEYGIMRDWDVRIRASGQGQGDRERRDLFNGETVLMKLRAAYCRSQGTHAVWRIGQVFLTNSRLVLQHPIGGKVLFETPLVNIKSLAIEGDGYPSEEEPSNLSLLLDGGHTARLHTLSASKLGSAIRGQMVALEAKWKETASRPPQPFN